MNENEQVWEEPASVEDAIKLSRALNVRAQALEVELGDNDRRVDGRRIGRCEYNDWRKVTATEKNRIRHQIVFLKGWIKTNYVSQTQTQPQPHWGKIVGALERIADCLEGRH